MYNKLTSLLIVLLLPTLCFAEKTKSGDWWLDLQEDSTITEAFTGNNSGSTFGFACITSVNKCIYYISPQTTCEDGSTSIILINSDIGALSSSVTCTKLENTYYSVISDTENVHSAVLKSKNIGIAFPMESGQFKVVRFSLIGANSAILRASEKAAAMVKNTDQVL